MNVMDGVQLGAKDLSTLVQVMQVGPGEVSTGVAITIRVDRTCIGFMGRIPDSHHALRGKQVPVPGISSRHHTIHHIHAPVHTFHKILWRAYAHQVTRFIYRHFGRYVLDDSHHVFFRLTHG